MGTEGEIVNKLPTEGKKRGRPPGAPNKSKNNLQSAAHIGHQVFPASEICSIIAQCGKYNVATFNFGGLSLTFSTDSSQKPDTRAGQAQKFGNVIPPQEIIFPGEKVLKEELRQADLLITDPFVYEQEQIDGMMNPNSSRTRLNEESEDSFRPQ